MSSMRSSLSIHLKITTACIICASGVNVLLSFCRYALHRVALFTPHAVAAAWGVICFLGGYWIMGGLSKEMRHVYSSIKSSIANLTTSY